MVPGQRRRFRKGWSERFDPRRYRRDFLNGTYPGGQRKLLGSHGGKSLTSDWTDSRRKKIIENILDKESKEISLPDFRFEDFEDDYDYDEWDDDYEEEDYLDDNDYDYDVFDYSDV